MPRSISNEQRNELFDVASDLENPISDIQSFAIVLFRISESLSDQRDGAAISIIATELEKRERQLSKMHGQLFHGLHESPRADVVDDEVRLDRLLSITRATGQSLDDLEAQSRGMDAQSFGEWADRQAA